jgi:hypothetical protein
MEKCETSPFEVDAKHMQFWDECLDDEYGRRDAQPQVVMVPGVVARAMTWDQPEESGTRFERREIVYRRQS